jgi:hypothetical protein
MNWEAISALSEVIGAIAVVATLAYLAVQIRQSTETNASAIRQSFYDYTTRQMLHGTDTADFNVLLDRAMMTEEELSPTDCRVRCRLLQTNIQPELACQ